jgi:hypothetical protein
MKASECLWHTTAHPSLLGLLSQPHRVLPVLLHHLHPIAGSLFGLLHHRLEVLSLLVQLLHLLFQLLLLRKEFLLHCLELKELFFLARMLACMLARRHGLLPRWQHVLLAWMVRDILQLLLLL